MVFCRSNSDVIFVVRMETLPDVVQFFVVVIGFSFSDNVFEKSVRNMNLMRDFIKIRIFRNLENIILLHRQFLFAGQIRNDLIGNCVYMRSAFLDLNNRCCTDFKQFIKPLMREINNRKINQPTEKKYDDSKNKHQEKHCFGLIGRDSLQHRLCFFQYVAHSDDGVNNLVVVLTVQFFP